MYFDSKALILISDLRMSTRGFLKWCLLPIWIIAIQVKCSGQKSPISEQKGFLSGTVALTNNGISLIPTFTLNKPATVADFAVGKGRLSFDPEFSFSLEGKPWNFLLWWRYQIKAEGKFRLHAGIHPAFAFTTESFTSNGVTRNYTVAQRYLAEEIVPSYAFSSHFTVGIYYLYSAGLSSDATRNTHFINLNINFENIPLGYKYNFSISPTIYYLNLDSKAGMYISNFFSLNRNNFPLSVNTTLNKALHTMVDPAQDLVWNISLVYSFYGQYKKVKRSEQ